MNAYALIAAFVLGAIGAAWITHEIDQGRINQILLTDATALNKSHTDATVEAARLQANATAADQEKLDATQSLNAYMAAHPVGAVLVCKQPAGHSGQGLPGAPAAATGPAGAGTGPAAVPEVLAGGASEAIDVGPEQRTILQSAAELAIRYRRFQQQPVVP